MLKVRVAAQRGFDEFPWWKNAVLECRWKKSCSNICLCHRNINPSTRETDRDVEKGILEPNNDDEMWFGWFHWNAMFYSVLCTQSEPQREIWKIPHVPMCVRLYRHKPVGYVNFARFPIDWRRQHVLFQYEIHNFDTYVLKFGCAFRLVVEFKIPQRFFTTSFFGLFFMSVIIQEDLFRFYTFLYIFIRGFSAIHIVKCVRRCLLAPHGWSWLNFAIATEMLQELLFPSLAWSIWSKEKHHPEANSSGISVYVCTFTFFVAYTFFLPFHL